MNMGDRIKELRIEKGLTQEELGQILGVGKAAIWKYEKGVVANIKRSSIQKMSEYFKVSPNYIMGYSDNRTDKQSTELDLSSLGLLPLPKTVQKPRLGVIACGEPILAEENFDGYDDVPESINCDFTLQCKGDSMINARINDGDIVYIKCQPIVDNGEIAAVMVNGETTLKRVFVYENKVILQAENPKYRPFVYVDEELNNIRILGKAVGFYSSL